MAGFMLIRGRIMGFMGFSTVDYYINKDFIERGEAARITFFE